jgi:hypothetical protein
MSGRVANPVRHPSVSRREFTLEAALAILAGCVITITEGCGSSSTSPTPTPSTPQVSDLQGSISANHGHVATITAAQITTGNEVALDIHGQANHAHTVTVSQGNLTTLKGRQQVSLTSTTDSSHSHTVTFTPA